MGVAIGDYDNDHWPDIFVANDLTGNLLYRNLGGGRFEEVGVAAGAALSEDGVEQGSMGVDFGDYNNDGWLDLYYTNSSYQSNTLLLNNRDGSFTHATNPAGHGESTYLFVGWGTSFGDLDNDGWEDLIVTNGHLYPEADRFQMGLKYKQRTLLFLNRGNGTFREISEQAGLSRPQKGRGLALGDYDNDGDIDLLINNIDDPPTLCAMARGSNRAPLAYSALCWPQKQSLRHRDSRFACVAGTLRQIRESKAGTSYLSQNDPRMHFGLGSHDVADEIEIRWPSGKVDRLAE